MKLQADLREFIALLNSHGVKYLVVGGYAVAYHAVPRYTGDIDIFVERSSDNALRLESVIRDFGFSDTGLSRDCWTMADLPTLTASLAVVPERPV